ncbi:hypothetical protein EOS93_25335 [Rhizobium sp. RMa-01]|uniref:hypothetical protein n=1 Tax=unclassified Rhizobium TaxID=2613769 RepID=UPI0008DA0155|nr:MULTISPECIES: hypothetical protein [unclassified Rhizobium]OHV24917.1 hypothetical protein BBJ66_22500 [Rhizobium sp. RSm-3]RVU08375.1 hypothetical protein EOS93_25335 [Rhizobium sp. RMa-01]
MAADYSEFLRMPRRDNSAYLEAGRRFREAVAQAEAEIGAQVTAHSEWTRDEAGAYIMTTVIKPAAGECTMSKEQRALKLFRGFSKAVWEKRFQDAGWPAEAADYMALWLTIGGNDPPPPDFAEIAAAVEKRQE